MFGRQICVNARCLKFLPITDPDLIDTGHPFGYVMKVKARRTEVALCWFGRKEHLRLQLRNRNVVFILAPASKRHG